MSPLQQHLTAEISFDLVNNCFLVRSGGGGGHSSSSHSSSSHSSSSHSSSYSSSGDSGDSTELSSSVASFLCFVVLAVFGLIFATRFLLLIASGIQTIINFFNPKNNSAISNLSSKSEFPDGLSPEKVKTSFLAVQSAWQLKDLKNIRHWISDGVYQRYMVQFNIMNKLSQVNQLSNIRIEDIDIISLSTQGEYTIADVSISFTMNDHFICAPYPELNEAYDNDSATEIWTYIRKTQKEGEKDLYAVNNCPNCGAPLEIAMGEISRCANCHTLTNNAAYDWVLCEITQSDDYSTMDNPLIDDKRLIDLTKNDSLFCVSRMEDLASNIFMQIMDVYSGANPRRLNRFANEDLIPEIIKQQEVCLFNRLYLNSVELNDFDVDDDLLALKFTLTATAQKVQTIPKLKLIDSKMIEHYYEMTLTKKISALKTPEKDTVYSYECPNCGAPYEDTTNDVCNYCGATVVDPNYNWVLTSFEEV